MKNLKAFLKISLVAGVLLLSGCAENSNYEEIIGVATQNKITTTTNIESDDFSTTPEITTGEETVLTDDSSTPAVTTTAPLTETEPVATTTTITNKPTTTTTIATKKPSTTTTTTKKATTTTTEKKKTTTTTKKATTTTTTPKKTTTITTKEAIITTKVTSTKDYPYDNKTYEYIAEVVRLCNIERAEAGLSPLTLDPTLTKATMIRADELTELFSHTRPDGNSCFTALEEVGADYMTAGENIACGYVSPKDVVDGWMSSEGHRANILNEKFTKIGVGYVYSSSGIYRHYWVQMFTD